ncbi:Bifunctional protein: zinc-containing alcohol dehydrogenase; quinone oxidoreductase (NADPH:quinone reductase); Similar to arginate lyase [Ochrobactrum soli]|uniref:Bifunctional protein: zinc-containing alcohol dehydrogenase quinone oxidoreductase ( NADPH:quinone reductase) Similar to arginate lyase n=1 Tax=Ochrobactrum soli TaxID=2448455 RepID=A0A2P9HEL8_9HYPH|nr:Bifunctional protein: zinc-containing alcohol dehydrogenase; quinone oxidoreductase (NADPH:quinone reductase); Similar to arginate lyase [[Ochrobactrum] soli]
MNDMMKAIRLHAFDGPEVLIYEDAPKPQPKAEELLVRVMAVGINPPDWYLRDGLRSLPPEWRPKGDFPIIPGTDISGLIEAVGDGVQGFSAGDDVYAMVKFPEGLFGDSTAYADYVTVPAAHAALKPAGLDHIHAAGAPMSLPTGWQYLVALGQDVQNPLQPKRHDPVPLADKTILVNGAAGGVGHFAMQIAK